MKNIGILLFALLLILLAACKGQHERNPASTVFDARFDAKPATDAKPPLRTAHQAVTIAEFEDSRLVVCAEVRVGIGSHDADALATSQREIAQDLETLAKEAAAQPRPPRRKGATVTARKMPNTCQEQFADRVILASCTVGPTSLPVEDLPAGVVANLLMVQHHYDIAQIDGDDKAMLECMAKDGKWEALPKDSADYMMERMKHNNRGYRKLLGQ